MKTIARGVVKAPMISIESQYSLDLVTTDFLKVDQGIGNILVITDHFTIAIGCINVQLTRARCGHIIIRLDNHAFCI